MENKNNKRKVPKMTYSVALKETYSTFIIEVVNYLHN